MNPKLDQDVDHDLDLDDDDILDEEIEAFAASTQAVCERISHWVRMFLAPTSCPYARDAWSGSLCRIYVREDFDGLTHTKATDPITDGEVGLYVVTNPMAMSFEQFTAFLAEQNRNHFGVWLVGLHPDDPHIERVPGHDQLHGLILIKMMALPPLAKAASRLAADGFYAKLTPADLRPIVERGALARAWQLALAHDYARHDDLAIQSFYDNTAH